VLVFVPVFLQRSQAAFLRAHRSLEFAIQPVHPRFVLARHRGRLFPANLRNVIEMFLNFIEQSLAVIAFARHHPLILALARACKLRRRGVLAFYPYQYNFNAICICRGEFAWLVTSPKDVLLRFAAVPVGAPNNTRL
jgi:hypothetical protein